MGIINKSQKRILPFLIVGLAPIISALIYCAISGVNLLDIYIPLGGWSDEITYYKQIEALANDGIKGYFGFNESRALLGGYAYWGPLPLVPYVVFGKLFGWHYISPVLANIVLTTIGMVLVVLVGELDIKQSALVGAGCLLSPLYIRHMLSGVVESFYVAMTTVAFVCYVFFALEKYSKKIRYILLMIGLALTFYLVACRAYYAVLFIFPFFATLVKKDKKLCNVVVVTATISLIAFFILRKYFCAEYFDGAYGKNISQKIIELPKTIVQFVKYCWYAVRYREATVPWCYLLWTCSFFAVILKLITDKVKKGMTGYISLGIIIAETAFLLSIFVLYDLSVGGRHFIPFIAINAIWIIISNRWSMVVLLIIIGVSQFWLGTDLDLPCKDIGYSNWLANVEREMDQKINLTDDLSYDNVIGMSTRDFDAEGNNIATYYGYLYAAPTGMGVSIDTFENYEDIGSIKAKYIMAHPLGEIDRRLEEYGYVRIIDREEFVILTLE